MPNWSSELAKTVGERNSCPNKNVEMAKGKVSRRGAWELIFPSLLCPNLLFTKDPRESPTMQPRPKTQPNENAV